MEKTRYFLALLALVTFPPAFIFWLGVHPFARFWRRLPPWLSYVILLGSLVPIGWGLCAARGLVLRVEYGFRPSLAVLAAVAYAVAVVLEVLCRRHLKLRILVGLPEVSERASGELLTEGIYGRMRHPRYVSFLFGFLAVALFTNYLAIWVSLLLFFPLIYGLVLLEERELRQRFGKAYEEYARRVPRFVPRFGL